MISDETISGLIDALEQLSDATEGIVHGGTVPHEAQIINNLNSTSTTDALSANMGRELKEMIEQGSGVDAYTKAETNALLAGKADVGDSYTKSEENTLLMGKADASTTYTKSEVNTLLNGKADKATTYTKSEVDALIQGGGTPVDAYTKSETDALLSTKADKATTYTKTEVDTALSSKANSTDVYSKTETYSKSEANTLLDGKANASTTYSKTEVDTLMNGKANASTTYTKTEVDNLVDGKVPTGDSSDIGKVLTKISASGNGWVNAQASYTDYSNTQSGLNATKVQGAIDEVNGNVTNKANLKLATSGNTATGEIRFGKDGNGNYGYIPEGADTVIPFSSGGEPAVLAQYIALRIQNYPTVLKQWMEYDSTKYDTNNESPSAIQKFYAKYITTSSSSLSNIFDDAYINVTKDSNNMIYTPKVDCIFRRVGYKPEVITANTSKTISASVSDIYSFVFYDD